MSLSHNVRTDILMVFIQAFLTCKVCKHVLLHPKGSISAHTFYSMKVWQIFDSSVYMSLYERLVCTKTFSTKFFYCLFCFLFSFLSFDASDFRFPFSFFPFIPSSSSRSIFSWFDTLNVHKANSTSWGVQESESIENSTKALTKTADNCYIHSRYQQTISLQPATLHYAEQAAGLLPFSQSRT